MAFGGRCGDTEDFRRFFKGQANQISQLHQFGLFLIPRGEFVQCFVDGEQFVVAGNCRDVNVLNVPALPAAAVALRLFAAGALDEDAAHGFGRRTEEMTATLELRLAVLADKSQPGFVNVRGGLQGLARHLIRHFVRGEFAEFLIDEWEQLLGSVRIAASDGVENLRAVTHARPRMTLRRGRARIGRTVHRLRVSLR